jgi:hypothetical protein
VFLAYERQRERPEGFLSAANEVGRFKVHNPSSFELTFASALRVFWLVLSLLPELGRRGEGKGRESVGGSDAGFVRIGDDVHGVIPPFGWLRNLASLPIELFKKS